MNQKVIFILAGGVRKDESGQWHSTTFETDNPSSGGYLRVVAASYLYQENPELLIIASGGIGRQRGIKSGVPTLAEIITQELIDLGVNEGNILQENNSGTTYEQLRELKKIIKEKDLKDVVIISNRYHLPRIKTMIDLDKDLSEGSISLKSAEEILLTHDPQRWQAIINKAYASESMEERIEQEKRGVADLKLGKYKF